MLTNLMYIFWIVINVFQIINLFLFLNVRYPINLSSFFRVFKTFNFDFIGNAGSDFDKDNNSHYVFGNEVIDQDAPEAFQRENLSANFFTNGTKYLLIFLALWVILALLRAMRTALFP